MAIAVVFRDQIVYAKAFGLANVETHQPVTLDTVWTPTRVGEAFSAMTIAELAKEGVLSLDEPIGKYWAGTESSNRANHDPATFSQQRGGIRDDHIDFALLDAGSLARSMRSAAIQTVSLPSRAKLNRSRADPAIWRLQSRNRHQELASMICLKAESSGLWGSNKHTSLSILQVATQPIAQGHKKGSAWPGGCPSVGPELGWLAYYSRFSPPSPKGYRSSELLSTKGDGRAARSSPSRLLRKHFRSCRCVRGRLTQLRVGPVLQHGIILTLRSGLAS